MGLRCCRELPDCDCYLPGASGASPSDDLRHALEAGLTGNESSSAGHMRRGMVEVQESISPCFAPGSTAAAVYSSAGIDSLAAGFAAGFAHALTPAGAREPLADLEKSCDDACDVEVPAEQRLGTVSGSAIAVMAEGKQPSVPGRRQQLNGETAAGNSGGNNAKVSKVAVDRAAQAAMLEARVDSLKTELADARRQLQVVRQDPKTPIWLELTAAEGPNVIIVSTLEDDECSI